MQNHFKRLRIIAMTLALLGASTHALAGNCVCDVHSPVKANTGTYLSDYHWVLTGDCTPESGYGDHIPALGSGRSYEEAKRNCEAARTRYESDFRTTEDSRLSACESKLVQIQNQIDSLSPSLSTLSGSKAQVQRLYQTLWPNSSEASNLSAQ